MIILEDCVIAINIENLNVLNYNDIQLYPHNTCKCVEIILENIDNKNNIGQILSIVQKELERNIQQNIFLKSLVIIIIYIYKKI